MGLDGGEARLGPGGDEVVEQPVLLPVRLLAGLPAVEELDQEPCLGAKPADLSMVAWLHESS